MALHALHRCADQLASKTTTDSRSDSTSGSSWGWSISTARGTCQVHVAGKVIPPFTGGAMLVAMKAGCEKLLGTKGIQQLADTIRDCIFRATCESRHRVNDTVHL